MFGDMMNMMSKLKESQQKIEETKSRLKTVLIDESSSDNLLNITATASGTIKSLNIDDELLSDKDQLEDYLILTLNKVLEKANNIKETELAAAAKEGMPNIPGLDNFM